MRCSGQKVIILINKIKNIKLTLIVIFNCRLQADFVAMNGTFKKILNVPHGSYDGFIISASKFQGNIYLCVFDTKEKILKERGMLDNDDYKFLYWGFKFEQFVVSGK